MQIKTFRNIWKILLLVVSITLALHFLKDITQDLLKISTPLDLMGDIKEDVSTLHPVIRTMYWGLWIVATLGQVVVGYSTLKTWQKTNFNKYDLIAVSFILLFLAMFSWAYSLA